MAKSHKTKSRKSTTKSRKSKSRKTKSTKSVKKGKFQSGTLTSFGYNNKLPVAQKQKALCAASNFWGKDVVKKKLQLVSNLNVHKNPALSKRFSKDRSLINNCK